MATEQSLFGATPEAIQQARDAALNTQASQYAQLDPFQQATFNIYRGANQLGGAVGGMLGGQDPQLAKASVMKQLASQSDTTTPEGLQQYARALAGAGFNQEALQAAQASQAGQLQAAQLGKVQAELTGITTKAERDAGFTKAMAELPIGATDADRLKIAMQFGGQDTVMKVIEMSTNKEAARSLALSTLEANNAAKMERLKENNASADERNKATIEGRLQYAGLLAAFKQSAQANKPLSASLQKAEDTDLASIDNYTAQQEALAPSIKNLTRDEKGLRKLELGPLNNAYYASRNAMNQSTPESRAYETLKSAVDTAVNLQVSAEKGVQTDRDVVRFAQALVAAYGRNDTEATLSALKRYNAAIKTASERTRTRLESRRKSQGVEAYSAPESSSGTPSNPIKLD